MEDSMVLESAKPRLKKLAEIAARLNEASDRFSLELKAIEAELQATDLGVAVEMVSPLRHGAVETRENRSGDMERFENV